MVHKSVDKSVPVMLQAYLKNVHHLFGPSQKILSDNGSEFKNQLFETIAQELGIEHKVYSPPFRPQSNSQIEGFHTFLKVRWPNMSAKNWSGMKCVL